MQEKSYSNRLYKYEETKKIKKSIFKTKERERLQKVISMYQNGGFHAVGCVAG